MADMMAGGGPRVKLAVIVGAGGMGMAVARRVAQSHRVLLVDKDIERAAECAERLREEGGIAVAHRCDVTDAGSVAELAQEVGRLGQFGALVHVAGLSPSMADFAAIVNVNLIGVKQVAEQLLPHAGPGTAAVLISSLAAHGFDPEPSVAAALREACDAQAVERLSAMLGEDDRSPGMGYRLSKWALTDFCRRSATAWGARGARIMSLSPGLIATPMGALETAANPIKRRMLESSPIPREGTMQEIADAVEFLLSERASFITGSDLLVDGGVNAATNVPQI